MGTPSWHMGQSHHCTKSQGVWVWKRQWEWCWGEEMLQIRSSHVPCDGVPSGGMLLLQSDRGLLRIPQNLVSVTCELQTLWGPPGPAPSPPTLQHPSMILRHPFSSQFWGS